MKNPLPRFFRWVFECPFPLLGSVLLSGFVLVTFFLPDVLAAAPSGNESASGEGNDSSWVMAMLFGLGLIVLAAIVVGGLTLWGKKQDDINHMMSFCIKFLIDTQDEAERCKAAQALGGAKDPGASARIGRCDHRREGGGYRPRGRASRTSRKWACNTASTERSSSDLLSAVQDKDHQKVIDLLTSKFESRSKRNTCKPLTSLAGNTYGLGIMRTPGRWLHVAAYRNSRTPTYGNQIRELADICNEHLFAQGDRLFNAGYYHDAKAQLCDGIALSRRCGKKALRLLSAPGKRVLQTRRLRGCGSGAVTGIAAPPRDRYDTYLEQAVTKAARSGRRDEGNRTGTGTARYGDRRVRFGHHEEVDTAHTRTLTTALPIDSVSFRGFRGHKKRRKNIATESTENTETI